MKLWQAVIISFLLAYPVAEPYKELGGYWYFLPPFVLGVTLGKMVKYD